MGEPGTPLPWATENDGRVIVNANGDMIVGDHGMTQNVASYIVEACNAYPQLQKDVADLNRLLRDVGWGQGEIDTAAVVAEENEQLRGALRKLVKVAEQVRPGVKKCLAFVYGTRYADLRPLPKLPEPKEEPKLFVDEFDGTFSLTAEGRRRLERLLRESEAKDDN